MGTAAIVALLVSLGIQVTQATIEMVRGARDKKEAEQILKDAGERPTYEIPEGVDKMVETYKQLAEGGMPGEELMKQDIQASTARDVTAIGQLADSPVGALGAFGASKQRENQALRDLSIRSAQFQASQQQNLAQAYGQQANWENMQWDWNQGRRWQEAQNEYWNLRRSGREGVSQGLDTMGSAAASTAGTFAQMNMYNNMMPNYNNYGGQQSYLPPPTSVPYTDTGAIPSNTGYGSFYNR